MPRLSDVNERRFLNLVIAILHTRRIIYFFFHLGFNVLLLPLVTLLLLHFYAFLLSAAMNEFILLAPQSEFCFRAIEKKVNAPANRLKSRAV